MTQLDQFKKIFDARHEFGDSDLEVLQERHPEVEFVDIPTAWILAIDIMLCGMRRNNPVRRVRQEYGQLLLDYTNDPEMLQYVDLYQPYVVVAERKIYEADRDLYKQFGIEPGER